MEWQTEAIDTDAHPISPTVATHVREAEKAAGKDGFDVLDAALASAEGLTPAKAATVRAILRNVRGSIDAALGLLGTPSVQLSKPFETDFSHANARPDHAGSVGEIALMPLSDSDERQVEGVFDGQGMIGDDGKAYAIPPNYASKSKLVEGDMLKLTIGQRGNFIYKQIGPIERQRLIGTLAYDQESGQYLVVAGGRSWKVLKASITYYKAGAGDEAVILVPKNAPSHWAAVENVIRKASTASF